MKKCNCQSLVPSEFVPKVKENSTHSLKKIKIYNSKEKILKESSDPGKELLKLLLGTNNNEGSNKKMKKQLSIEKIRKNSKDKKDDVKINLVALYKSPQKNSSKDDKKKENKEIPNNLKNENVASNHQDCITHENKNEASISDKLTNKGIKNIINKNEKRLIIRPNTGLKEVNIAFDKNTDVTKKYDFEKSKLLVQKLKNMNNNLKKCLNSYKVTERFEIKPKTTGMKRSSSYQQKSKESERINEKNEKDLDTINSEIYNFTFKPKDIEINMKNMPIKKVKKSKNIKSQINKKNEIKKIRSRSLNHEETTCSEKEKHKKDSLNGIYLIKNEIRVIKPKENDNNTNHNEIPQKMEIKQENVVVSPKNTNTNMNSNQAIKITSNSDINSLQASKKDGQCNNSSYLKNINNVLEYPAKGDIKQVTHEAKFEKVPSINDYFNQIINIDESFKNSKFKNFYRKNFPSPKNDNSLTICNLSDPKNLITTSDKLLKNDIMNLRDSKEYEEKLKIEKKLKLRLINKDKDYTNVKNKEINKETKKNKNSEKENEYLKTEVSSTSTELGFNALNNLKATVLVTKPPTPKKQNRIKLSDVMTNEPRNDKKLLPDNQNDSHIGKNHITEINDETKSYKRAISDASINHTNSNSNSNSNRNSINSINYNTKLRNLDDSFSNLRNQINNLCGNKYADNANAKNSENEMNSINNDSERISQLDLQDKNIKVSGKIKSCIPSPKIMKNHPDLKNFFQ